MLLYNAGVFASNFHKTGQLYARLDDTERWMRDSCVNHLESYHYVSSPRLAQRIRRDKVDMFMDSGAFTAFTKGTKIDLGEYCDYIHANQDIIRVAAVLDEIGDADGTYRNQMEMERRGVRPIPCFHFGEPIEALQHYVANYDYLAIGGVAQARNTKALIVWLDRIWEEMVHADGTPKVKVHGFAITALKVMVRYPWHSVDSSTWVQWAANGAIYLSPRIGQLYISNRAPQRKVKGQHADALSPAEMKQVQKEVSYRCIDIDRLRNNYYSRWAWNIWAFPAFAVGTDRFVPERMELF